MPQLIRTIDQIARQKKHGVLFIMFTEWDALGKPAYLESNHEWERNPMRDIVIKWMESNGISWEPCGSFASENCLMSYLGEIYIDVPYDRNDLNYQMVSRYFEDEK